MNMCYTEFRTNFCSDNNFHILHAHLNKMHAVQWGAQMKTVVHFHKKPPISENELTSKSWFCEIPLAIFPQRNFWSEFSESHSYHDLLFTNKIDDNHDVVLSRWSWLLSAVNWRGWIYEERNWFATSYLIA